MRYQQTIEIHERIETVRRLIEAGEYSTPALAETVGVSIPTISRIVAALREQGHDIRAERRDGCWRYVFVSDKLSKSAGNAKGSGRHPSAISSVASEADRQRGTIRGAVK